MQITARRPRTIEVTVESLQISDDLAAAALKRAFDVVFTLLLLAVGLPVMLVIAAAIAIDSPGGVIHTQERVGRDGRRFQLFKFRSMRADAEARLDEVLAQNEADGPVFKIRHDPRVTRVGRLIRRTSLDELPQLVNVLRGEMSVVGPRPPLPREVALYRPSDRVRLVVKPGLTCLWQISGRSNIDFDRWMELDREYIRTRGFLTDLIIVARTAIVVLTAHGAY